MPRPGVLRKLKLYASIVGYSLRHNRDFAREHYEFFDTLRRRLGERGVSLEGARVLDVGCGKAHWLTLLLHSVGARVTGIDTEFVAPGRSLGKYWGILRSNGLDRTLRTLVWDWTFGRWYYQELARIADFDLKFRGVDVCQGDVTNSAFDDDTFDLVVSHEVFEHVPDLEAAARELRRIMKPNALTYIYFHNFASVSGGHHIAWKYPDTEPSDEVPPWDHLRENRFPDIPSWLNRCRESEYRRAFEAHFDLVDWIPLATEGEALLTDEIRDELSDYTEEELLTKGWVIVGRPLPPEHEHTRMDS